VPEGPERAGPDDDVLSAFVTRLKAMPVSDPRARIAILARVRGRRQSPWRATLAWAWQPSVPLLAAAAVVVAAVGVGYAGRVLVEPAPAVVSARDGGVSPEFIPASNDRSEAALVPRQFIFEARGANRVAIVGDFNGWDAAATPLKDPTHTGVWEATLLLPQGRHTYAFLVNDTLLKLDPRMPSETDPDFGRMSSVILVTK
jgi:hypothetical protein